MKIDVIEANMTGWQHSFHNSCCIKIIHNIADTIQIFCSKEHKKCLDIPNDIIVYDIIKVLPPGKNRIKKFFLEYLQTMTLIKNSDADLIFFLSSFPNVQYFYILNAKKFNDKKVIIMTHGEAEGLILPGRKWKFWSYPFWITLCFKLKLPKNIFRIVLGESILNNLKSFSDSDQIFYIDQPRDSFRDENTVLPLPKNNTFAFIGNCLYKKGGESFVKAANQVKMDSDSIFEIIGAYDLDESISKNVTLFSKPHEMIPRNLFNEALEKVTYACFPYPSNTYKFTASGAVLDAVIYLKPIVYIKNDYFDGIFKDAGDIGYRCENEKDFIETIKKLDENPDVNRYKQQVENLKRLQNKFSIDNIEKQIRAIVVNIMAK